MRLEKMVEQILPLHTGVLRPKHRKGEVIYQEDISGFYPSGQRRKSIMGDFYEVLSWMIYGGKLNDRRYGMDFVNGIPVLREVKPDLIDDKNKTMGEVKANHSGDTCNFTATQVRGYKMLQYDNLDYDFSIHIYRHSVEEIEKRDRTYSELLDRSSEETRYSLVLPISIFFPLIISHGKGGNLVYLYNNNKSGWEETFCIKSSTTTGFFIEPEKNLDMLGLEPDRFEIQRTLSPSNIRINGRRIRQFPIVKIIDRAYGGWVKNGFMKQYEEEMERPDVELDEMPLFEESRVGGVPFD